MFAANWLVERGYGKASQHIEVIRPKMLTSWWTDEVAAALQQFYHDLIAGKRPPLAIGALSSGCIVGPQLCRRSSNNNAIAGINPTIHCRVRIAGLVSDV
jgi:hypothetical protein